MQEKRFTKNDSGFICANCGEKTPPLSYSSRDHCRRCLCSLHVDVNPGDRANGCGGLLTPQRTEPDPRKGFIIYYKCSKCGARVRCRSASDDDTDLLIKLTVNRDR